MKLQSIRLRGFKGIRHGLGVDQIELDLSGLDGLIALTGHNGAGKTTLMEQLQPFPQVVSRPNPALKNHVYLRDSEKDLSFRLNGHDYRTLVKIDAQSGRAEGYLWEDGRPMVEGKISSFTRAIERLFGSPELFFASVFAAQGAAKISDLRPAEFKKLMGEFLRLDRYFEWEKTAKEAEARIMRIIAGLDRGIERAEASMAAIEDPDARRQAANLKIEDLSAQKRWAEEKIQTITADLESAQARAAEARALVGTLETERQRLADIDRRIDAQKKAGAKKIQEAEDRAKDAAAAVSALESVLLRAEKIEAAAEEAKKNRAAVADLEKEREACFRSIQTIDDILHEMRQKHQKLRAEKEAALEALRSEHAELSAKHAEAQRNVDRIAHERGALVAGSNIPRLDAEIEALERQAKNLEQRGTVSCSACSTGFACNSQDCAFIRSALDAADALPAKYAERDAEVARIKAEGSRLELERAENDKILAEAKAALDKNIIQGREAKVALVKLTDEQKVEISHQEFRRAEIKKDADALTAKIEAKQAEIANLEITAAEIDKIKAARERLPEAKGASEAAEKNLAGIKAEAEEALNILYEDRARAQAGVNDLINRIDAKTGEDVESLAAKLEGHKKSLREIEEAVSETRAALATIEADARRVRELQEEIETLRFRRGRLVAEAAEWAYLKNATGANGLRALEIDATAPLISRYANDLLTATYGPAHSLELRTQDDEGREVLLPVVTREDGSSEIIGQFSGGEKTWDLKALRLALTLVAKQKSGRDFGTAFADEEDGALDLEAATAFINMYREFLKLGGFGSIYFISHKPECVGLADHRIVFNGGVHVE